MNKYSCYWVVSESIILVPFPSPSASVHTHQSNYKRQIFLVMNDSIAFFYSKCSVEFNVGFTVVTSLLMVAAVVGNIMIFVAVYTTQNLKTSANYYIVNMAVSDLLLAIVVGPWSALYYLRDLKMFASIDMSLKSFLCKSVVFVGTFSCTVSIASLVLITVDRFIACVYPLKMKLITGKFRRIVLFLTWILAVPFNFNFFLTIHPSITIQRAKWYV